MFRCVEGAVGLEQSLCIFLELLDDRAMGRNIGELGRRKSWEFYCVPV